VLVSRVLFASGLTLIVVGVVLAIAVSPLLGLIALVGVGDLVLARMFRSGRFGTSTAGEAGDAPVNPYARED
jgi:hypothetical protein